MEKKYLPEGRSNRVPVQLNRAVLKHPKFRYSLKLIQIIELFEIYRNRLREIKKVADFYLKS